MMPLSIEGLRSALRHRVQTGQREFASRSVHILERPLAARTTLQIGPNRHDVPQESFLVVIDEAPGAYWTHPVTYELHEVQTGKVRTIHAEHPIESPEIRADLVAVHVPDLPWLKHEDEQGFLEAGPMGPEDLPEHLGVTYGVPLAQASTRHALFFAGMDNMPDFHNDFVIMRQILVNRYGYLPGNIVISMGDGSGYADLPVDHAGDAAGLDAALDSFAVGGSRALGPGDTLFLYTFNHGGNDTGGSYLCLPDWASYYASHLRTKLDNIQCAQLIVAMNQCHSGGFVEDVTATTGPSQVAIMTACRADQSAYPSGGGGSHGYFSVVLATALNWAFPAGVTATFPGYVAGAVTAQDGNNDGLVSAEDAWLYVQQMMQTHHAQTMGGIETPQWGVSAPGVGANLFWGLPDVVVEDGSPWWESPDVFLLDPAVVPDDTSSAPGHPANWSDYYHLDTVNRVVARVHNAGCAPARNVSVQFRATSFGVGGGTTVIGTFPIVSIDPGQHAYAYVDWFCASSLVHRCISVRADCLGDPAASFGSPIDADDNQAQRNLDPLFAAFGLAAAQVIEGTFVLANPAPKPVVFTVAPVATRERTTLIRPVLPKPGEKLTFELRPGAQQEVTVRFEVSPRVKNGVKLQLPLEVRAIRPLRRLIGGVTFTVEAAEGKLVGRVANRFGITPAGGTISLRNVKQKNITYSSTLSMTGEFVFPQVVPGPYTVVVSAKATTAISSVFVQPNRTTSKTIFLETPRPVPALATT